MDGTRRADIRPGISVMVELTEDKRTGRLTGGRVKEVLTSSPVHPHGIKVMLERTCRKNQTDYLNSAVNHSFQSFKKLTNF